MMEDALKRLTDRKPLGHLHTSIGWLAIFEITLGDQTGILEKIADVGLEKCDPLRYVKEIVPYVCMTEENEGQINKKSSGVKIDQKVIAPLSDEDLEAIAKIYNKGVTLKYKKMSVRAKMAKPIFSTCTGEKSFNSRKLKVLVKPL